MGLLLDPIAGALGSVRRLCSALTAGFSARAQLFLLELREEGRAVFTALLVFLAACGIIWLSVALATAGLILLLWDLAGIKIVFALALLYLFLGVAVLYRAYLFLKNRKPFQRTLTELRKDATWLGKD